MLQSGKGIREPVCPRLPRSLMAVPSMPSIREQGPGLSGREPAGVESLIWPQSGPDKDSCRGSWTQLPQQLCSGAGRLDRGASRILLQAAQGAVQGCGQHQAAGAPP